MVERVLLSVGTASIARKLRLLHCVGTSHHNKNGPSQNAETFFVRIVATKKQTNIAIKQRTRVEVFFLKGETKCNRRVSQPVRDAI